MSSGVNHNIDGANPIKYFLVKPNIGFLVMSSQEGSIWIVQALDSTFSKYRRGGNI